MLPHTSWWGLSTLVKELTVAIRIMESSFNELSTPVPVSVYVNKGKMIHTRKKSFDYDGGTDGYEVCYQADVKLVGFTSQLEASRVSSHTHEL